MAKETAEDICRTIDPSLHYRRTLSTFSTQVYQVEREGTAYILKIGKDKWARRHLENERKILSYCEDIPEITNVVEMYTPERFKIALLKEYAPGETLAYPLPLGARSSIQSSLERTVMKIHARQIANLDLHPANIVVVFPDYADAEVKLIDLGTAHRYSRRISGAFQKWAEKDLRDLESLFLIA